MLFDSGASHSFISDRCAQRYELHVYKLPYDLKVFTPARVSVMTSCVCLDLILKYDIFESKVDLICLPLKGIDVIIGMDWLSTNNAYLDYKGKKVNFPSCLPSIEVASGSLLLSATQVEKCIRQGC